MPKKKEWLKNSILVMHEDTFSPELKKWISSANDDTIISDIKVNGKQKKLGTINHLDFIGNPMTICIKLGKTADDLGYPIEAYNKITVSVDKGKATLIVYTE